MEEFLQLPYASSAYGDFGVSYIGVECRVHFQYNKDRVENIGELFFDFCIRASLNGDLDNPQGLIASG